MARLHRFAQEALLNGKRASAVGRPGDRSPFGRGGGGSKGFHFQPPAADLALVKQMARQNQLPSLKRLSGTWSRLSPQHARVAYAAAYQAAEALFAAYGNDGARNLVRNPETLAQVSAELDRRVRQ